MKLPGLASDKIWITGMPFSGKSSAARKLASKLGWKRLDTDAEIERETGKSVAQIFAEDGELAFRSYEKDLVERLGEQTEIVISTGGGLPVFYDNIDRMLASGVVVFLNTSLPVLAERSLTDEDRPLLRFVERTPEARLDFMRKMLFERLSWYGRAHHTFTSERELLEWAESFSAGQAG